ncbi:MAG: hypothetical protein AAFV49_04510 [Pseudomonadota bacterium]
MLKEPVRDLPARRRRKTLTTVGIAGLMLTAGCSNPITYFYGNSGATPPFAGSQEKELRRIDLVQLLDPAGLRHSAPASSSKAKSGSDDEESSVSESDVMNALLQFGSYGNNIRGGESVDDLIGMQRNASPREDFPLRRDADGKAFGCSETGRAFDEVDRTIKAKVTTRVTRTRVDVLFDKDGKEVNEKGKESDKIEEVKLLEITQQPKIEPANLCPLQRRMLERRNAITALLIGASDRECARYLVSVQRYNSDINFGASLTALALGTAGALAGGAANIIAGAAGAVGAVPSAIEQSYFGGQALNVIARKLSEVRALEKAQIEARYGWPPVSVDKGGYPVERAIADVVQYHNRCSLQYGLEVIDEASTTANIASVLKAKDEIQKAAAAAAAGASGTASEGEGATPTPGS